jgi:4-diphosphocytidyl-2-C-methyl-D-erythritol kinase
VIVFPNCKINLGLNIIHKRNDGYHDLETVFYPLTLCDALEMVTLPQSEQNKISDHHFGALSISGETIDGAPDENLCVKAYSQLKNKFPQIPPVRMHLHKSIPPGSGLGGGSADGAFTLRLLNDTFQLGLTIEQLLDQALQLGSDCPFFMINKPCFATGRGEFLERLTVDLSAHKIVLVVPPLHVRTSEIFSSVKPVRPSQSIKEIIQQPVETWAQNLKNDFEEPVFNKYPEIRNIKDQLYKAGAMYSSLSGSGSAVYGIFRRDATPHLAFGPKYFLKELISKPQ